MIRNSILFLALTGFFLGSWGPVGHVEAARKVRFAKRSLGRAPINPKDLALKKVTSSRYTETFSLWAWNKKGWSVFGVFLIARVHPFVGTRVGVQLSVYDPQGRVYHKMQEFKVRHLIAKKKRLFLMVAKHYLKSGVQKGRMRIQWDKFGLNLQFGTLLKGVRLYGGPVRLGRRRFIGVSFGPRLEVSGTLNIKGQRVRFDGIGHAERSWQNVPHKMARRWFNLRAFNNDYTVLATELLPLREWRPRSIPSLSIAYKDKWVVLARPEHIQYAVRQKKHDKKSGYRVPQYIRYRAKVPNGASVDVIIRAKRRLHRLDVLSHIPGWLRNLVQKLITKPFMYRYVNQVNLKISHKGKTERTQLKGMSEWVFLNL